MPEHSATFYKNNIKYDVFATSLPVMVAGLKHPMEKSTSFFADFALSREINYVVDVGANMGFTALMYHFAYPNAKILAVEPSSYNMKFLQRNVDRIENIDTLQVAAVSKTRELEIALPSREQRGDIQLVTEEWDNTGAISIYGETDLYREQVKGVRLDDVVTQRVDFLKLDIEGAELEALKGAHRILSEDTPFIQIELRVANLLMAHTDVHEVHRLIQSYGYARVGRYAGDSIYCHTGEDYEKVAEHKVKKHFAAPSERLYDTFRFHLRNHDYRFVEQIKKVKDIKNIYDVGACIGVMSILLASVFDDAYVYAYEPLSKNFSYLIMNIKWNSRIVPERCALSNKNGTLKIAMPTREQRPEMDKDAEENPAIVSVYGESDLYSEEVRAYVLDDVAENKVDLLKIDVEGHEYEVLEGAERVLMNDRPIVFLNVREGTQRMAGSTTDELRRKIGTYGYKRVGHYKGDAIYFPEELELPEDIPLEMAK